MFDLQLKRTSFSQLDNDKLNVDTASLCKYFNEENAFLIYDETILF